MCVFLVFTFDLYVIFFLLRSLNSVCSCFTFCMPLQGVDGSGPYGPNPDLDRPPMDDSGIGPDPSGPDSAKSSHAMTSGSDAVML